MLESERTIGGCVSPKELSVGSLGTDVHGVPVRWRPFRPSVRLGLSVEVASTWSALVCFSRPSDALAGGLSQKNTSPSSAFACSACSRALSMRPSHLPASAAAATMLFVILVDRVQSSNQHFSSSSGTSDYSICPILEDKCRCTVDLREFTCRSAGFEEVPKEIPRTVTKL